MTKRPSHLSFYNVNYTTAGGLTGKWCFFAIDREDALKQAKELMPVSYKIESIHIEEEW